MDVLVSANTKELGVKMEIGVLRNIFLAFFLIHTANVSDILDYYIHVYVTRSSE